MSLIKKFNIYANRVFWQRFLVAQGYALVVNGVDGDVPTSQATQDFQRKHGITPDGIVGEAETLPAAYKLGLAALAPIDAEPPASSTPGTTPTRPRSGKLILISAGHTNDPHSDRGVGANGFIEGVETLRLRDAVAANLRTRGCNVIEDGDDGENEPLTKAIALARKAKIAIEFHFNAGPLGANGVEVLSKLKDKAMSIKLAGAVKKITNIGLRGGAMGWKSDSSGAHHRLGFIEAGGVIVEVCFLTNLADMKAYRENFDALVDAIAAVLAEA